MKYREAYDIAVNGVPPKNIDEWDLAHSKLEMLVKTFDSLPSKEEADDILTDVTNGLLGFKQDLNDLIPKIQILFDMIYKDNI